ncbi:hypothetical protein OS493_029644, partial [Desmophyllum pertusum]
MSGQMGHGSGTERLVKKFIQHHTSLVLTGITVILKPGMNTSDISDKWTRPTSNVKNITVYDPPGV